jgi:hypothetical protein
MIMLRIPKDMEGRRLSILLPGIPVAEVKVQKITDEEVIGLYIDNEEIHINHNKVMAWWPSTRKIMSNETKAKIKRSKAIKDKPIDTERPESIEEETDTPEETEE